MKFIIFSRPSRHWVYIPVGLHSCSKESLLGTPESDYAPGVDDHVDEAGVDDDVDDDGVDDDVGDDNDEDDHEDETHQPGLSGNWRVH